MPSKSYSYKTELQKECSKRAKKLSTTVFGLTYANGSEQQQDNYHENSSEEERFIVACSSNGKICIWDTMIKYVETQTATTSEENKSHRPNFSFKVCNGILYDVKFDIIHSSNTSILITCGECGIFVYQWKDIISAMDDQGKQKHQHQQKKNPIKPISVMKPHPNSTLTRTEVNRISFDSINGYLYGACGDFFGGYIWDINTSKLLGHLKVESSSKRSNSNGGSSSRSSRDFNKIPYQPSYLHTIKAITSPSCPSNHLVMTGDDNGEIGFWNGREQKLIESIHCKSSLMNCNANQNSLISDNNSTSSHLRNASCWVSNIDVDDSGRWSVVGGGFDHYYSNHNTSSSSSSSSSTSSSGSGSKTLDNGFLALLNVQTRTLSSCSTTREIVNDVAFHSCLDKIVSVGNNGIVSFWNQADLTKGRNDNAWVTSPSAYSIAIQRRKGGIMTVGGVGSVLDCYSHFGYRSST